MSRRGSLGELWGIRGWLKIVLRALRELGGLGSKIVLGALREVGGLGGWLEIVCGALGQLENLWGRFRALNL